MTALWEAFARNPGVGALGWALLNFIWQGTLLAFVLECVLAALHRHSANLRYWTAMATLLLMLLVPLGTLCMPRTFPASMVPSATVAAPIASSLVAGPVPVPPPSDTRSRTAAPGRPIRDVQAWLPGRLPVWMSTFWILGVVIVAMRTLGGLLQADRLLRSAREVSADADVADLIERSFLINSSAGVGFSNGCFRYFVISNIGSLPTAENCRRAPL